MNADTPLDPDDISAKLHEKVAQVRSKYGIDPYTPEFVFGNNCEYTRLRNSVISCGPGSSITMLRAMLRNGLDEVNRQKLFQSYFDLGTRKSIPAQRKSLVALAEVIRRKKHLPIDLATRKSEFESITAALKPITGKRFGQYKDKQNSLRVVYLLARLMLDPKDSYEGRINRILTFIKIPTSKFSFETRSSYPTADSENITHLLNDLKAYVCIEIEPSIIDRIDLTFNSLIDRINRIRGSLDEWAHCPGEIGRVAANYHALNQSIGSLRTMQGEEPPDAAGRLDVDLYTHLHRLEFLHFAGEHSHILGLAEPSSPITPIREELILALSAITGGRRTYRDTTLDKFLLSEFPTFVRENEEHLRPLIEKAIRITSIKDQYGQISSLSYELLYRVKLFGGDTGLPRERFVVCFRGIVSALCSVAQALEHRTNYRPPIYADNSQPRSIITPLETPIDLEDEVPPAEIYESHLQIWHNRREWVQDALEGNFDIAQLRFNLRKLLWVKAGECVRLVNIRSIDRGIADLESSLLALIQDKASSAPTQTSAT